jgi:hypothetical protein
VSGLWKGYSEMKIRNAVKRLEDKITKLYNDIKDIRETCPHEHLQGKFGANTGNWCSSDDSYWVDFVCQDCGKRWTEDQMEIGYGVTKDGFKFTRVKEFVVTS